MTTPSWIPLLHTRGLIIPAVHTCSHSPILRRLSPSLSWKTSRYVSRNCCRQRLTGQHCRGSVSKGSRCSRCPNNSSHHFHASNKTIWKSTPPSPPTGTTKCRIHPFGLFNRRSVATRRSSNNILRSTVLPRSTRSHLASVKFRTCSQSVQRPVSTPLTSMVSRMKGIVWLAVGTCPSTLRVWIDPQILIVYRTLWWRTSRMHDSYSFSRWQ